MDPIMVHTRAHTHTHDMSGQHACRVAWAQQKWATTNVSHTLKGLTAHEALVHENGALLGLSFFGVFLDTLRGNPCPTFGVGCLVRHINRQAELDVMSLLSIAHIDLWM